MVADGLLSSAEADKVAKSRTLRFDHPLELIADQKLQSQKPPNKTMTLEWLVEWLAAKLDVPYLHIDPLKIDLGAVTQTMSNAYAERYRILPVNVDRLTLTVATGEPFVRSFADELEKILKLDVKFVFANPADIRRYLGEFYNLARSMKKASETAKGELSLARNFEQLVELGRHGHLDANDTHVVHIVDWLWQYAFEQRASDIHLEPRAGDACVRFRIDGILHDIEAFPIAVHNAIVSRVKVMARMDIAERRRPQDGRIKTKRGQSEIELRVASIPTAFGEKVVVRILDPSILMADLADLGFAPSERELYEKWITSPSGLILVTGPTGSGKTTTLYATLRYLAGPEVNITTVEEPIEMIDPRFVQVQVQRKIELTFAAALRAMLRQDPDIIMVGEIRDAETAQMAVQSALTGHLVLSTVHTRDAAGAVTRLAELGVERFLLSSVLRGVLAQRLLRRICSHCAVDGHLTPDQVAALGIKVPVERRERLAVRWGEGCVECRHTGLYGRTGVFELLNVARRVRELVKKGEDATEIARAAKVEGMESLRESALRRLAEGVTTYEEVIRVTADMD